jgi:hypothetical protein
LARLTDARFSVPGEQIRETPYNLRDVTYDRQGNITNLTRWAPTSGTPAGEVIDQLSYTYQAGTNRLEAVADAVASGLDWDAAPTSFVYDRAGNAVEIVETRPTGTPSSIIRQTEVLRLDCLPRLAGSATCRRSSASPPAWGRARSASG